MNLGPDDSLPDLIREAIEADDMDDRSFRVALADLYELSFIKGFKVSGPEYPVVVLGLTAIGRQELPSG